MTVTSDNFMELRPCPCCGQGKFAPSAKHCHLCGYRPPYESYKEFFESFITVCVFLGGVTVAGVVELMGCPKITGSWTHDLIIAIFLTNSILFLAMLITSFILSLRLPKDSIFEIERIDKQTIENSAIGLLISLAIGILLTWVGLIALAYVLSWWGWIIAIPFIGILVLYLLPYKALNIELKQEKQ